MRKIFYKALILVFLLLLSSCGRLEGLRSGLIPMHPGTSGEMIEQIVNNEEKYAFLKSYIDVSFEVKSVNFYNKQFNINLEELNHSFEREKTYHYFYDYLKYKANSELENNNGIDINDYAMIYKYQLFRYNPNIFLKKIEHIKGNSYKINANVCPNFEKKEGTHGCWVSCVQCLLNDNNGRHYSQNKLLEIAGSDSYYQGGDLLDIFKSLGFSNVWLSEGNSLQLLSTLGDNHPVIMLSEPLNGKEGHAVVIVGAKFSFVNLVDPAKSPQFGVAFSEFTILDPDDGQKHIVPAQEYDGKIRKINAFVSFYNSSHDDRICKQIDSMKEAGGEFLTKPLNPFKLLN